MDIKFWLNVANQASISISRRIGRGIEALTVNDYGYR